MDNNIKERVIACRTIRRYKQSDGPTKDELISFIDSARYAPSAANLQRIKYMPIFGRMADEVFSAISLGGYLPESSRPSYDERPGGYIALLCENDSIDTNLAIDLGLASEILVLGASEAGYGSCIIRNFKADMLREIANPGKWNFHLLIAFGTPGEISLVKEISEGESIKYYRDENDNNIVPKKALGDVVILP